ncbi:restriction endonuclease subunit S [Alistipes sp.]|uniref:restriction endonuclease subunit S n=1 Tax=Alistipes sp. TaxID=1872444 RepID=UPI003AEF51A2
MNYLEKILDGAKVEWKALGEVATINRGCRVTKCDLSPEKKYPVYSGGVTPMGYFDSYNNEANTITIVKYGTAGFVNFIMERFWANDICYCIKPSSNLDNKYLFYVLKNNQGHIKSLATDAIPAHLPTEAINSFQIPIPCPDNPEKSHKIQKEIVHILDTFTELTAELTAELIARKKQYEYYRDMLLTFPKDNLKE